MSISGSILRPWEFRILRLIPGQWPITAPLKAPFLQSPHQVPFTLSATWPVGSSGSLKVANVIKLEDINGAHNLTNPPPSTLFHLIHFFFIVQMEELIQTMLVPCGF